MAGVGGSLRNSVKIMPGALVCEAAELRGDITIGARTVVHPKARIIAEAGPIVIGEGNLIEEQSEIVNKFSGRLRFLFIVIYPMVVRRSRAAAAPPPPLNPSFALITQYILPLIQKCWYDDLLPYFAVNLTVFT